jgi:class 3 adenylate cyclase
MDKYFKFACPSASEYANEMHTRLRRAKECITAARDNQKKYVDLLSAVFPPIISKRLLDNEKLIADSYSDTTVLFIDIVGFTSFIADYEPEEIVPFLNKLFSRIDKSAKKYGVEKIKTIGDAYFAICGAPNPISNHCERTALFALEIMSYSSRFYKKYKLNFRIGMHTGPVIGGVIGESKPVFDIWGDTVNVASRMESNAQPGCIQVSECVYKVLSPLGFKLKKIGTIQVKGKGEMCTWQLMAKPKNFSLPL